MSAIITRAHSKIAFEDRGVTGGPTRIKFVETELVWRSRPVTKALKPRLTANLQLNTAGRTSFASFGAEWRQHMLRGRAYGQIGTGIAIHDGYRFTSDPLAPGLTYDEFRRRADLYYDRTSFGSRVLLNPNLSPGVRIDRRWAVGAAFEHYSHKKLFLQQTPASTTSASRMASDSKRRSPPALARRVQSADGVRCLKIGCGPAAHASVRGVQSSSGPVRAARRRCRHVATTRSSTIG